MTDELKKQLTERFEQLVPAEFTNPTMYDSLLKVYLAGGEYGYELGYTAKRIDIGLPYLEN